MKWLCARRFTQRASTASAGCRRRCCGASLLRSAKKSKRLFQKANPAWARPEYPKTKLANRLGFPRRRARRRRPVQLPLDVAVAASVGEVDDQADDQPAQENFPRQQVQRNHHEQRNEHAHDGHEWNPWRAEGTLEVGLLFAEDPDAGADDGEGEKRADAGEFAERGDGQSGGQERDDDANEHGGNVRRAEARMNFAGPFAEQAVVGHGEEDARLAKEHDEHGGAESADGADFYEVAAPANAGDVNAESDGVADVEASVRSESREDDGDENVKNRADYERTEDTDGHVA